MMWTYEGLPIRDHSDLLEGCTDIVYVINYTNGQKYIGKKTVRSIRRLKPTKAMLAKRKNYVRKELKDLPFIDYEGSSELTSELTIKSKEILYQTKTKKAATYLESAELFATDAIFENEYVNKNIQGRFFDNDLIGLL